MWHVRERRKKCTRFWWEILTERNHSEEQGREWHQIGSYGDRLGDVDWI
jgi:hypothetical protein